MKRNTKRTAKTFAADLQNAFSFNIILTDNAQVHLSILPAEISVLWHKECTIGVTGIVCLGST